MKCFPILYDKRVKGFKGKDPVQNACGKPAETLDFAKNCNFIRASSNWECFEDSCSENIGAFFFVRNSYKILANQFDLCRIFFGFR